MLVLNLQNFLQTAFLQCYQDLVDDDALVASALLLLIVHTTLLRGQPSSPRKCIAKLMLWLVVLFGMALIKLTIALSSCAIISITYKNTKLWLGGKAVGQP